MSVPEFPLGSSARHRHVLPSALGYPTIMLMIWVVMEYCRPTYTLKITTIISITLFLSWLVDRRKVFVPQVILCFLFLALMVAFTPFAFNNYAAYLITRPVAVVILCIAVPLGHFVDSLPRFDALFRTWVASLFYVAVVVVFSGGYGPGSDSGVDENYAALFLSMTIGLSFFLVFETKSAWGKLALLTVIGFSCAGIVVGFSRGGFLSMAAVGAFCWWRSPYKLWPLVIVILFAGVVFMVAPDPYWDEVHSISDTGESTANERIDLWTVAVLMYLDNPIFGVGPGQFTWNFYDYRTQEAAYIVRLTATHSFYLELAADMGTVGMMLIAGIIYFNVRDLGLVKQIVNAQRELVEKSQSRLSVRDRADHLSRMARSQAYGNGLTAAFLGFFVGSIFLSTLYWTTLWVLTGFTMALRCSVTNEARDFAKHVEQSSAIADRPGRLSVESPNTGRAFISGRRER